MVFHYEDGISDGKMGLVFLIQINMEVEFLHKNWQNVYHNVIFVAYFPSDRVDGRNLFAIMHVEIDTTKMTGLVLTLKFTYKNKYKCGFFAQKFAKY